jgi:hypothetical protein
MDWNAMQQQGQPRPPAGNNFNPQPQMQQPQMMQQNAMRNLAQGAAQWGGQMGPKPQGPMGPSPQMQQRMMPMNRQGMMRGRDPRQMMQQRQASSRMGMRGRDWARGPQMQSDPRAQQMMQAQQNMMLQRQQQMQQQPPPPQMDPRAQAMQQAGQARMMNQMGRPGYY